MSVVPVTALPRALLPKLLMLDSVPSIALQSEPRVSYCAWIPDAHYPLHEDQTTKLPLLVAIHGTHRGQERNVNIWKNFGNTERCAVVAPLFPAMVQGPLDGDGYHYLGCPPAIEGSLLDEVIKKSVVVKGTEGYSDIKIRYDHVLLDILDEVSARWPAIDTSRIFLVGFSGGGQFVHRFAYLHPRRLLALSVGAPGSVTMLDGTRPWPFGTQNIHETFEQDVDMNSLQELPILAVVGGEDNKGQVTQARKIIKGEEFGMEEEVKKSRVKRLGELVESWKDAGLNVQMCLVPGIGHSMEGVHGPVEDFMRTHIRSWWASKGPMLD